MESKSVITWAIVLAAVMAGILLYMLSSNNPSTSLRVNPSPTPSPTPLETSLPAPSVEVQITDEQIEQVDVMAPTGASPLLLLAALTSVTVGASGLLFRRHLFSL